MSVASLRERLLGVRSCWIFLIHGLGRRCYCWVGRWYVPIGCVWHCLAAICDVSFDWGWELPVCGKGGRRGLETGPLSSPVMTSYSLPIGLSLTVFVVLWLVKDRRADEIGLAKSTSCTKVHRPPKTKKIMLASGVMCPCTAVVQKWRCLEHTSIQCLNLASLSLSSLTTSPLTDSRQWSLQRYIVLALYQLIH